MMFAFAAAFFALAADIKRRHFNIDPFNIVAYVAIAGILGAKIWHMVDTPADRINAQILQSASEFIRWFRGGFAWFGGFVAGIATLLLLARRYRINMLTMLDVCSPSAAIGYAVGRIGCLVSGDGDYGIPTNLPWGMAFPHGMVPTTGSDGICLKSGWPENCAVHPTPIYEFIACMAIFWYIWRRGSKAAGAGLPPGLITGEFLMLFGAERFLVEFIRINRITQTLILGMSNAQFAALLTTIAGAGLMLLAHRARSPKASQPV